MKNWDAHAKALLSLEDWECEFEVFFSKVVELIRKRGRSYGSFITDEVEHELLYKLPSLIGIKGTDLPEIRKPWDQIQPIKRWLTSVIDNKLKDAAKGFRKTSGVSLEDIQNTETISQLSPWNYYLMEALLSRCRELLQGMAPSRSGTILDYIIALQCLREMVQWVETETGIKVSAFKLGSREIGMKWGFPPELVDTIRSRFREQLKASNKIENIRLDR